MSVRAKFKVNRFESSLTQRATPETRDKQHPDRVYETAEMRTVVMNPVYQPDPGSENHVFWEASPTGELKLGTVNPEAWQFFELGQEYYLDFTKAE